MKTGEFKLTQKSAGSKAKAKQIIKGTYWQCLAKFHELCLFSYTNHKMFIDIEYSIIPTKK